MNDGLVLGIDPGATGALVAYRPGVLIVEDMPTFQMTVNKKTRTRIDALKLYNIVETMKLVGVELAVLEAVGGRPKQSASNAFVFGYGVGLIYMALIQARIPVETVVPGTWKKVMKLPGKKAKTLAERRANESELKQRVCNEILPGHEKEFVGPKGGARIDRMEAGAMAVFGYRHMLNSVRPDAEHRLVYEKSTMDLGGV
jgi:hypothetical protein